MPLAAQGLSERTQHYRLRGRPLKTCFYGKDQGNGGVPSSTISFVFEPLMRSPGLNTFSSENAFPRASFQHMEMAPLTHPRKRRVGCGGAGTDEQRNINAILFFHLTTMIHREG